MSDLLAKDPPAAVSDERPTTPKKISTPAGDRLQTILEGGNAQRKSFRTSKQSIGGSTALGFVDTEQSYTTIWSDAGLVAKEGQARPGNWLTRRGGWKRLLLILLLIVLILVGLIVGLVLGLRDGHHDSDNSTPTPQSSSAPSADPQASAPATTVTQGDITAQPTSTATGSATATPSGFPIGEYSFVTFLDTVATNCTSNPSTWTCAPYTLYSDDPTTSMATFNWNITAGSTADTWQISSVLNPFATSFTDISMSLVDRGKATEHYFFEFLLDKQVRPTSSLTDDNTATVCFFNSTTFQAFLYTKEARSYPAKTMETQASYQLWPFAVRVEEVIGGGDNVPNCYTSINNLVGAPVNSSSLTPQPAGDFCDCLYLNYLP